MTEAATAARAVVVERELPHPPEKVWRALTQAAMLAEWLMQNDFAPVVGHRFNFRTAPMPHWDGVVHCEVLAVEPHARLAYTWNAAGAGAAEGLRTVVTWTLTPVAGGTRLRLEQAGFRGGDEAGYRGASTGWRRFLGGLEKVLAGME